MPPQWIDQPDELRELIDTVCREPRYALDTEFHGERSYWPRLALIQIAWSGGIALVDPLAVDPVPLATLLSGPGCMVAHAADQDLSILERACGVAPSRLFDTQVAAGFIGMGTPSLAAAVERLAGVRLGKGDRLTDWTRRPLTAEQRAYAAADVEHLLALHDELTSRLDAVGRLAWAIDECEERRSHIRSRPDIETAWWRMKGARQLRGTTRGVAQKVAAWRERTAESLDVPARFVLSDLALAGVVHRPPRSREDLGAIRGIDGRLRDHTADALLAAVQEGLALPKSELRVPETDRVDRSLAPAVTVLGAWLAQRAAELDLDPSLLATRAELTQLLQGGESRLAGGWRADLVGEPLQRLLSGEAVLALRDGGRRIEMRDT
ncbi:MAG TPA: HRDC domain-containing protein [Acidimicrobiia bacterium]|nr:HRDC domain-containing protein [Acidimicrobiia bacterium]